MFTIKALIQFSMILFSVLAVGCSTGSWREASRDSSGLAPLSTETPEAVIQVYGADAWGWRGWFAIHTWIAVKARDASEYTVLEVIGWRAKRGLSVLRVENDIPDRYWFGSQPQILLDKRGDEAEELIEEIVALAERYPWANEYKVFPGPNSNTFPAWIAAQVPELGLELPFSAIGSGYVD
ncbi:MULTISPECIES: DUF3750 domain-containing protein [unclassified Oleiphilus]|jgi:hypothetical protein|uniref:DUF3750 domain-containing protein n=3 Tax=Oleiphilus TaxID=141450 RepID=UPI0007C3A5EA|nr:MULTISPECIES: DUF3750 domain-containing protein [unclassified Oleiphilus]KZY40542.1 hypothetical protein A3732_19640 [Oleiphilus sp. HI0050]KZY74316.1 hypothetical protein A3740_16910 [Oleiphilus sp. HI0068]KZY82665.1 hypothetical protein A3741_16840 [Oleiphilus sp. HI0069]KZY38712.1 hypothetical protein A3729_15805 [Oleiphilus sp. HI0043]KZY60290.1 hypothetical protein A3735_13110 [Oleiphilus sp. HI0061]